MSDQKWTQEPWSLAIPTGGKPDRGICISCPDGALATIHRESDSYFADPTGTANGHRIVACVNALAGIADPAAFMAAVRELREWEKEHGDCLSSSCWKDFRAAIRDVTDMLPENADAK